MGNNHLSLYDIITVDWFNVSHTATVTVVQTLNPELKTDTTNSRGSTPLIIAVYNENEAATKILLAKGAHADVKDRVGNTAMMGACFKSYIKIVSLLYGYHADVNSQNFNGATALIALIFASTYGHNDIVKLLLKEGTDKSIKDKWGKTALDYAVNQENS